MRRTRFDEWPCPIARVADLLGDWWTPLVLREAVLGARRFEQFQERLGIPRAVLSARLSRLVDDGVMVRYRYEERPPRDEYRLTEKGRAAWDVLAAMWRYGEDWFWPEGEAPPLALTDSDTGAMIRPRVVDESTGAPLDLLSTRLRRRPV
jgi:DNA-binding HxlR family transcriptional regulator